MSDAKHDLVDFLVRRAFEPVLKAKPDGRSDIERRALANVQKATRSEIDRFRRYGSAEEVVTNFKRDLHSAPANKVQSELKSLSLPTLHDVRDEFERKAAELGVG